MSRCPLRIRVLNRRKCQSDKSLRTERLAQTCAPEKESCAANKDTEIQLLLMQLACQRSASFSHHLRADGLALRKGGRGSLAVIYRGLELRNCNPATLDPTFRASRQSKLLACRRIVPSGLRPTA